MPVVRGIKTLEEYEFKNMSSCHCRIVTGLTIAGQSKKLYNINYPIWHAKLEDLGNCFVKRYGLAFSVLLSSILRIILWENLFKCFSLLLHTGLELGFCERETADFSAKDIKIMAAIGELRQT